MSTGGTQLGFDFDGPPHGDGLARWHAERRGALEALARQLGFPLGHRVEVVLLDGTCLRGGLCLATDELLIEPRRDLELDLRIDRCSFAARDIGSCVRLD